MLRYVLQKKILKNVAKLTEKHLWMSIKNVTGFGLVAKFLRIAFLWNMCKAGTETLDLRGDFRPETQKIVFGRHLLGSQELKVLKFGWDSRSKTKDENSVTAWNLRPNTHDCWNVDRSQDWDCCNSRLRRAV